MGDLKTYWTDPALSTVDPAGDLATARGSAPQTPADGGGSGLQPLWGADQSVPIPAGAETANSVSGLPSLPSRMQTVESPPMPPSLEDYSPGTIDEQ